MIRYSDKALVSKFLEGKSYKEIAKEFNVAVHNIEGRIGFLRRRGVRIPRRASTLSKQDVNRLNELIEGRTAP